MNLNLDSAHSRPRAPHTRAGTAGSELSLGELIELVASIVPEDEVAETVAALFDRGRASFARLLSQDERAALRKAS